jgi:hypothetical protein
MSTTFPIEFGKAYDSRKKSAGWIWRCGCAQCKGLPDGRRRIYGPFKSARAAERNAEQCIMLLSCDRNEMGTA